MPVSPRLRGFVTVALASPYGGGALPLTLPCGVRTFLGGFRRRDRRAYSALLVYRPSAEISVLDHRARYLVYETTCSSHVFGHRISGQLAVELEELFSRIFSSEYTHVITQLRDIE